MIDVSRSKITTIRHLMSLRKRMLGLAIGEFLAKMSDAFYELHKSAYVDPYIFPGRKP